MADQSRDLRKAWTWTLFRPAVVLTGLLVLFIVCFTDLAWALTMMGLQIILPFAIVGWGIWMICGMPGRKKKKEH